MKRVFVIVAMVIFGSSGLWATSLVSFTVTGTLNELRDGNTVLKVGEVTLTNDEAATDFTLTISGTGVLTRVGGTGQVGDSVTYTITMTDTGTGTLTATTSAPGLPTSYDLSTGDYDVVFLTPQTEAPYK